MTSKRKDVIESYKEVVEELKEIFNSDIANESDLFTLLEEAKILISAQERYIKFLEESQQ